MSKKRVEAVQALSMLAERLKGTSLGWLLPTLGIDPKSIASYVRTHKDVKDAINLWLEDVKKIMEEGDDRGK